ncbi:S-adenosyl-L-methionine-dependent methyltransferase [Podospora didyma]|uniref:S-adenosyl-L-methionine-dependent methyltransferase n=1 Tax=Podospora didyma TaxID=330526 RepID=A0AAE0U6M1_9PEZI|nr:S-adenosyl-L-methionine-dependent methyltransferase [Podospora didyma]
MASNTAAAGDDARRQLMLSLHKLASSLETPNDTIHRFAHQNLQSAAVRVQTSNCLIAGRLGSLLRYCLALLPSNPLILKRTGYKNPSGELHTAFQDGHKTPVHAFEYFADHPEDLAHFNPYIELRRKSDLSWLSVYPVGEETAGLEDPERALFVNVGGGVGYQCAQFKERYPNVPGRVILQDLPHSIVQSCRTPGVENTVHDFFQPQPVKGAKFYHMRGVLHNHPPHKVRKLLEHTKAATAPDSVLLADEMVLPEMGVNYDVASIDLTMLGACASLERTEAQWREGGL